MTASWAITAGSMDRQERPCGAALSRGRTGTPITLQRRPAPRVATFESVSVVSLAGRDGGTGGEFRRKKVL